MKRRLLLVQKLLYETTDEQHQLTTFEILDYLESQGIVTNRKTLKCDIDLMVECGLDIITVSSKPNRYFWGARNFEQVELKLLIDAVSSSKFITRKKSEALIRKIEGLASIYEAKKLARNVHIANRIKTMNESIYYTVDDIHSAINGDRQISFQYFKWNEKGERELKRDGKLYKASPWALTWDDENYYLIAFDSSEDKIKHFRVDKMLHIDIKNEKREGRERFKAFDMAVYAKKTFGMFGGEEQTVKLRCENSFAGVMIDRFGKDVCMIPADDSHFTARVNVAVSRQFLGWVFALGEGVQIVEPEPVVQQMREEAERLARQYQG